MLPSKIKFFVDTGFGIVAVCGRCWDAVPAMASTRRLMGLFESEFWSLLLVQPMVICCLLIHVLRGFGVGVMLDHVVLGYVF